MSKIGKNIAKVDALEKVMGQVKFGADFGFSEALFLKVVRSSKCHARILSIDLDEALKVPGVVRIFTAKDIPGENRFGKIVRDQPILASKRVLYIGDPIAVLSAETQEAAEEAARKVFVTYQDLPSVTSPEEALQRSAPLIHERGNVLSEIHIVKGNIQEGFKEADIIVEKTYRTTWVEHCYMEPDAGFSYLDEQGRITVVCPSQYVHYHQKEVASFLSLSLEQVRIIQCATGGGFGGRLDITIQCLLALATFHLRRPAKIIYSREEVFRATPKRHPMKILYKSGAKKDGTLTAIEVDILGDTGAYASYGPTVAVRSAVHATGPYEVPHVKIRSRVVYTNNPVAGAMRGFGVAQTAFAHESQMDLLAQDLNIDPVEIRLKNALRIGSETATGQTLVASVGICETLRKIKRWRDRAFKTSLGTPRVKKGIGIGSMWYGIGSTGVSNPSTAQLEIDTTGEIRLLTGAADIGQGSDTILLQFASEVLGLPVLDIRLIRADTLLTPDSGSTGGSRQTYISGNAVIIAARNLIEEVLGESSRLLNVSKEELFFEAGEVKQRSNPMISISIRDLAKGCGRILRGEGVFDPETNELDPRTGQGVPFGTYAFATHLAEVDVDIDTGFVKVGRIVACHDVGRAINPKNVMGQVMGGVAMGIGFALMEEYVPKKTDSFNHYLIPTSKDVPEIIPIFVEDEEPTGPFGAKGVGEPALIPTAPAILNAIANAIGQRIYELPANLERVKGAVLQKNHPHSL